MNLKTLLYNIKANKIIGNIDINIRKLSQNSKKIIKNSLFFCISGIKTDGTVYINEAVKNGAKVVVLDKKHYQSFAEKQNCDRLKYTDNKKNITYIFVEDVRKAMAIMSANFYGNPQQKLKVMNQLI